MKEIIIIETNKPQKIKDFLDKEHFPYKVYQEPIKRKINKNIFSDYGEALKDKELEKEKSLLEKTDESDEYDEYEQEEWAK